MTTLEMNVCLKEYAEYKRIKEEAEKQLKALQAVIVSELEKLEKPEFIGNEHKASITTYERTSVDGKSLEKAYPDIYNMFSKTSAASRFNFK